MIIEFFTPGEPVGQPRPRACVRGKRKAGLVKRVCKRCGLTTQEISFKATAGVYDPDTAEEWKTRVALAAKRWRPKAPLEGPIRLTIHHHMPRPLEHWKARRAGGVLREDAPQHHTVKYDLDNLEKAAMDALTKAGIWRDDCQVCQKIGTKRYIAPGERVGAMVRIETVE